MRWGFRPNALVLAVLLAGLAGGAMVSEHLGGPSSRDIQLLAVGALAAALGGLIDK